MNVSGVLAEKVKQEFAPIKSRLQALAKTATQDQRRLPTGRHPTASLKTAFA